MEMDCFSMLEFADWMCLLLPLPFGLVCYWCLHSLLSMFLMIVHLPIKKQKDDFLIVEHDICYELKY